MNRTEQENFWAGDFGNEYTDRCTLERHKSAKIAFWTKILSS